jgi:hypothetical protein
MILLDDDLRFFRKRWDNRERLQLCTPGDVQEMFKAMFKLLKRFGHVGVSPREGNNRRTEYSLKNVRMMRVLGYDRDRVPPSCRFDRVPTKQDFDMTLQLLRAGIQNCVLYEWANNQYASGLKGGCDTYRTEEMNNASAEALKRLHPRFVTLVQRSNSNWKGFGSEFRTEVKIQWKQSLGQG